MVSPTFFQCIAQSITPMRLRQYHDAAGASASAESILALYTWNLALSEALYPTLQCLEVALRNSLQHTLSHFYHSDHWYDQPTVLQKDEADNLAEAKNRLARDRKQEIPDNVVAASTFGFWVGLLNHTTTANFGHGFSIKLFRMPQYSKIRGPRRWIGLNPSIAFVIGYFTMSQFGIPAISIRFTGI